MNKNNNDAVIDCVWGVTMASLNPGAEIETTCEHWGVQMHSTRALPVPVPRVLRREFGGHVNPIVNHELESKLTAWIAGKWVAFDSSAHVSELQCKTLRGREYLQLVCHKPVAVHGRVLPGELLLVICQSGGISDGDEYLGAGCMRAIPAGRPVSLWCHEQARVQLLRIPEAKLMRTVLGFGMYWRGGRYQPGDAIVSSEHAGCLAALVDDVFRLQRYQFQEEAIDDYVRLCDFLVLQGWPGNMTSFHLHRSIQHPMLRLAHDWLIRNIKNTFDIDALAQECCLSSRSLYNLFRRELDMTPGEYLRRLKMECAYRDLSAPLSRSVTEVAIDYGFSNLGRFAQQYRECMGELPSETLRRRRAGAC